MIHWQYIKGAYNQTKTNVGTKVLYTFINYYGGQNMPTALDQYMIPTVEICDNTNRNANDAVTKNAGHIICSEVSSQSINGSISLTGYLSTSQRIYTNDIWWKHPAGASSSILKYDTSTSRLILGEAINNITIGQNTSSINLNGNYTISKYLKIAGAGTHTNDGDLAAKNIFSIGVCEAQYFNATSDRRAKTDIKPINQSVLPLVINTQLYSFKYKDLDTPSIGIIAQDVQDVDFDGFSLVDNKEATGQDMDYMSIHESKLIYVLWKAVQEQQKEIEELKAQIKKGL